MLSLLTMLQTPAHPWWSGWSVKEWAALAGLLSLLGGVVATVGALLFATLLRRSVRREPREFAGLMLDALGEANVETKGFLDRMFVEEIKERREVFQLTRDLERRVDANQDAIDAVRQGLLQQGESLRILPALQETLTDFKRTLREVQSTMQTMERGLARIEGVMERDAWDGRERRNSDRRSH